MHDRLKYLISHTRAGTYFSTKFISTLLDPSPFVKESLEMADEYIEIGKPIFYVTGAYANIHDPDVIKRYKATETIIKHAGGLSYLQHEHVGDPEKNPSLTPDDIYTIDFLWSAVLSRAGIVWGYPSSLGVGIQLGWSDTYQIPTALLQPVDTRLSRVAEAIAQRFTVIRYTDNPVSWQKPLESFIKTQIGASGTKGR